jgi:hypothetical protein
MGQKTTLWGLDRLCGDLNPEHFPIRADFEKLLNGCADLANRNRKSAAPSAAATAA